MPSAVRNDRRQIFGCAIDCLTLPETVAVIEERLVDRQPVRHVAVNAAKVVMMRRDDALREIIKTADMVSADGQSIVWAARALGKPLPERVTGIDLMLALLKLADDKGYRVYFLGARDPVVNRFVSECRRLFPRLEVAGCRNGYFSAAENDAVVEQVRQARPDMLFVALGSPQKEYWLNANMEALEIPFAMGVGGSFDVIAGDVGRAPAWMQKAGLEWLHRLGREPRRMLKRYLVGNTVFVYLVAREMVAGRMNRKPA
jgi:N-acetylglucosaminyldiphosphoundecaprenol N-acetyl-beta-D-mannosaminyltransferase